MADLPENPNNREEEYLADMAGEDGTKPNKPWSRKEAYLSAISGRLDGIDAKIAALATDISLKGGVADYDHLPTDAAIGDAYITEDTGILYVWVGDEWTALNMQGGSGVIELTEQDVNYPTSTPDAIGTWLLDDGVYHFKNNGASAVYIRGNTNTTNDDAYVSIAAGKELGFVVLSMYDTNYASVKTTIFTKSSGLKNVWAKADGSASSDTERSWGILSNKDIYGNANKDRTKIGKDSDTAGYGAVAVGYMSRSRNTSSVAVGSGADAKNSLSVAIGGSAIAQGDGGIALGAYSSATTTGQFDVGTTNTNYGYNNSNYRLLTGVHDPQSDHDASTKGYVDGKNLVFYMSVDPTVTANAVTLYSDASCTTPISLKTFFSALRDGKSVCIQYRNGSGEYDNLSSFQILTSFLTNVDTEDAYNEVSPSAYYYVGNGWKHIGIYDVDPDATTGAFNIS